MFPDSASLHPGYLLISNQGTLVRTRVSEISCQGRNTQGVTLIRLPEDEKLAGVVRIETMGDEDSAEGNGEAEMPAANGSGEAGHGSLNQSSGV